MNYIELEEKQTKSDEQLDAAAEYADEKAEQNAYNRRWRCNDGYCGAEDCANCKRIY